MERAAARTKSPRPHARNKETKPNANTNNTNNNAQHAGCTALIEAAGNGHAEVVRELLAFDGCAVDAKDVRAWRPYASR